MARTVVLLLFSVQLALANAHYRQTYDSHRLQCRVDDPLSCSQAKREVCVFVNGQYRCECPTGVSRLSDGRCVLINECSRPSLNTCHKDAECVDQTDGYTCRCKSGFADISTDRVNKPGRICQRVANECHSKETYGVNCDENAACVDTPEGFQCVCQPGFVDISASVSMLPGRKCVEVVNECLNGEADCASDADCFDRPDGYECKCRPGFVDASPDVKHYPGRVCNRPKSPEYYGYMSRQSETSSSYESESVEYTVVKPQCRGNDCGPNEECRFNANGEKVCQCKRGSVQQSDGVCKVFSHCEKQNECDENAFCTNTYNGYSCQCKSGFRDVSPEPSRLPGRKCVALVNECADGTHDCSPYSDCKDTQTSYLCSCKEGYIDVTSRYGQEPGRRCAPPSNQCSDPSQNACDRNADCIQLPDGYTCKCFAGYVDVSSNANLQPGRICTLSTACPAQPTDLVFLIDGSGSIGSYIFQTEVLRFLGEFTDLFDIAPQKTRVSVVQFSDHIRHEFGLSDYSDSRSLHEGIRGISYLTGLTRTGAAIEHVANEAFSERRGARPRNQHVARVCIVITDGRSQDNVTIPSNNARLQDIQLFAVGVTNHVLDTELEEISGSKERTFHVNGFSDLNTRLRSAIQKVACPQPQQPSPKPERPGPCNPTTHDDCDRPKNEICVSRTRRQNQEFICECPAGFERHPVTGVCGGDICNPELPTSCPDPEICEKTPFGNWRCTCPADLGWRDMRTGLCKIGTKPVDDDNFRKDQCDSATPCRPGEQCRNGVCVCREGLMLDAKSEKCILPGTCDPNAPNACDERKKEKCLLDATGQYTCQCPRNWRRHPITEQCLKNECETGENDCDVNADCHDTDESYICTCRKGFTDKSPNLSRMPGRVCSKQVDECALHLHNCSIYADCFDLPEGFLCRCKDEYVDMSPNPQAFGGVECRPLVNECLNKNSNTCHEHADCHDTRDSYKCVCHEGYIDQDELRNPGRDCRKANQICDNNRHDCSRNARCIERGANDFECVCLAGFLDRSPLPQKTGRVCLERICLDDNKHDCHPQAVCEEVDGPEKYTCKCRDGYYDLNPAKAGRQCKDLVNECLIPSLNDCDTAATCHDLEVGYTCTCPVESKDISPNPRMPGRLCKALVNECLFPHLNNCSKFADCHDLEEGYSCRCKNEYYDLEPQQPGTNCKFIVNECLAANLNDCDKNAICKDRIDGYDCICKQPFIDMSPADKGAGRVCRYNECKDPKDNDCDKKNADCIDTDDSYTCRCHEGFYDEDTNGKNPGRVCIGLIIDQRQETEPTTINPNLFPCGSAWCRKDRHEVCIGGGKCGCRPGQARESEDQACVTVVEIPIVLLVDEYDGEPLQYSTDYSKPESAAHVEVVESAKKGIGSVLKSTDWAPRYVTTDVNYVTNPKAENPNWNRGLLINSTVRLSGEEPADVCRLWKQFAEGVEARGGRVDRLKVSDDFRLLDPCNVAPEPKGTPCGDTFCNDDLGEECIAGKICGCPRDMRRKNANSPCRVVESWNLPLIVVRDGRRKLHYTPELTNPQDDHYKDLVSRFETGLGQSYDKTPLKESFITAEVNDIEKPETRNSSWTTGLLYNFTTHFVKGSVQQPETVFTDLIEYIQKKNNMEVGQSKLFISPDQINIFGKCYNNDCGPNSICIENSRGYSCECMEGFRDLNPSKPGRNCLAYRGVNECERPELNECSVHARCIDLDYLYKCECLVPYVNAAEEPALPGSKCVIDHCSDVNYCPEHSICKNTGEEAVCECLPGFVDMRQQERFSEKRSLLSAIGSSSAPNVSAGSAGSAGSAATSSASLNHEQIVSKKITSRTSTTVVVQEKTRSKEGETYCLKLDQIDECERGLHNCSLAAKCINLKNGYTCQCLDGYEDGNPAEPGRLCAAKSCGLCNGHGACIHESAASASNVTCACDEGYTGAFCEVAPSNAGLILMLLLALLFLLLTLLCCLYLCFRCRCFGVPHRGFSEGSASGQEILGSEYYTIPRPKLKAAYGASSDMSELSIGISEEAAGGAASIVDISVAKALEQQNHQFCECRCAEEHFSTFGYGVSNVNYWDEMAGHDNAGALAAYLDDGASVSSDGSLEEIERRVTTDVTTREIRTTTVRDESGQIISQSQTVSHGAGAAAGGMETEAEQYAVTSSDHFRHAEGMNASSSAMHSAGGMHSAGAAGYRSSSRMSEYSDESMSGSESEDGGHEQFDRTTRTTQAHEFYPGNDPRTGVERRRNEVVRTTKQEEVNYF